MYRVSSWGRGFSLKIFPGAWGQEPNVDTKGLRCGKGGGSGSLRWIFPSGADLHVHQQSDCGGAVYEKFCTVLAEKVRQIVMGDPHRADTIVGPLIHEKQCQVLDGYVKDAVQKGARLLAGGKHQGAFYEPTLLADVTQEMEIFYEECFGPVVSVSCARDVCHGVELCNDNSYGLSSSVLTNDITLALSLSEEIEAGNGAHQRIHGSGIYKSAFWGRKEQRRGEGE